MTPRQHQVLDCIRRFEIKRKRPPHITEIARLLGLHHNTVTKEILFLEGAGEIEMERDPKTNQLLGFSAFKTIGYENGHRISFVKWPGRAA